MALKQDLIKHFEAIVGRKLQFPGDGVIVVREDIGISMPVVNGFVISREIGTTGDSTKSCRTGRIGEICGINFTDVNGSITFLLSDFFCGNSLFQQPVNFVATPIVKSPVYLTSIALPTNNGSDVTITVFTWNKTGAPAPNILFAWRCLVPERRIIT